MSSLLAFAGQIPNLQRVESTKKVRGVELDKWRWMLKKCGVSKMIESCMMMCGLLGDEPWWTLYMEHSPWNLTYLFRYQLMVCWCLLSSNAVSLIHNYTNDKKLFVNTSWDVCSDWRAVWICLSFPMVLLIQAMQSRIASLCAWMLYFRSNVVNSRRLSQRKSIEFHSKSCQWLRKSCTGTLCTFTLHHHISSL